MYIFVVKATDKAGNIAQSESRFFEVYDPTGGFATGGGWFIPDSESTLPEYGRENFGFVAKYKNGGSTGNLEFQYKDAEINLKLLSRDESISSRNHFFFSLNLIFGECFLLVASDSPPFLIISVKYAQIHVVHEPKIKFNYIYTDELNNRINIRKRRRKKH